VSRFADERASGTELAPGAMLLYLRHGACDPDPDRYPDPYALELSPVGCLQAAEAAAALADVPITRVVSSPYRRALQTAEVVAARCGLVPQQCDELRERSLSPLHGLTYREVARRIGTDAARTLQAGGPFELPECESVRRAADRAAAAGHALFPRVGETTLIVGHGRAHNAFCNSVLGLPTAGGPRLSLAFTRLSCFWRPGSTADAQLIGFNVSAGDAPSLVSALSRSG
jgi:broad specificity phosphatase PhoE